MSIKRFLPVVLVLALAVVVLAHSGLTRSASGDAAAGTVSLTIDTTKPGRLFRPGSVGLSIEAFELESTHLSRQHVRLVRLMRLLGPSVLRIGGNSVDASWWTSTDEPAPAWAENTVTPADLVRLRGVLHATAWRALLGIDLGHFEPSRAADEARYARRILGRNLLGVELGNEPDDFGKKPHLRAQNYDPSSYLGEAVAYRDAVTVSGAALLGPALAEPQWLSQLGNNLRMFSALTLHYYPAAACAGTGPTSAAPPAAGAELLAPTVRSEEEATLSKLLVAGALAGRPVRIGETNAAACTNSPSAAPIFASSLWALDWALRAVSDGVQGISFHGKFGYCEHDSPLCAETPQGSREGLLTAAPEYYGLLAARQLEGGRFLSATLGGPVPSGLASFATLSPNGVVKVALENLAATGRPQRVAITGFSGPFTTEALTGAAISSAQGITLARAPVSAHGEWRAKPVVHPLTRQPVVTVAPASALIVTLR
jgi:hypothetical protein